MPYAMPPPPEKPFAPAIYSKSVLPWDPEFANINPEADEHIFDSVEHTNWSSILHWHHHQQHNTTQQDIVHDTTIAMFHSPYNDAVQDQKLKVFLAVAKTWVNNKQGQHWLDSSFDSHPHRPILKVDSHQLDKKTNTPNGRHNCLTPCPALVHANHLVDKLCDLPMSKHSPRRGSAPHCKGITVDPHGL